MEHYLRNTLVYQLEVLRPLVRGGEGGGGGGGGGRR